MAGLYSAWRLLGNKPSQKIIILESQGRIGGRLATSQVHLGNDIDIQVEEGGMRFLDKHILLHKLIGQLNLERTIIPFGMGDNQNRFYIRGRGFSREEDNQRSNSTWSEIYKLETAEKNILPSGIIKNILLRIVSDSQGRGWLPNTPEEWSYFRTEGIFRLSGGNFEPVYNLGLRTILSEYGLSNECVKMLVDTSGFGSPFYELINAGSAFQLLANFQEDFSTLRDGFQALPEALRLQIQSSEHGQVHTNITAERIEKSNSGYTVFTNHKYRKKYNCSNLILALPVNPLTKLIDNSPLFSKNYTYELNILKSHLDKIIHMPLTKINLFYGENWWEPSLGISHGGCFTDLPLNSVYFFSNDQRNDSAQAITVYCDSTNISFWHELQSIGSLYGDVTLDPSLKKCSKILVRHIQKQLKLLFGLNNVPEPIFATYNAWGTSGKGQGDHLWRIGANDQDILERSWKPIQNEQVFICGEAFSDLQAWVEGALRSSERVLQLGFNIEKPF